MTGCFACLLLFRYKEQKKMNLIKIAICDDDTHFLDDIEKMLHTYESTSGQILSIKKFSTPERLKEAAGEFQVYFLDLKMPGINGLELAKSIRVHDERAVIIFITAYQEYIFDSFQFDIANYIMKPVTQIQIDCEMSRAIRKLRTYEQEYLVVKNSNGWNKIYLSEIQYMETYERKVLFHCGSRNEIGRYKLQDLEERLKNYPFIRCHNSYIVNVDYIRQIKGLSIILLSGETIYTTKYRKKEVLKKMAERVGCV